MENNKELKSGFEINGIILLESNFRRTPEVEFSDGTDDDLDISVNVDTTGNMVVVEETVSFIRRFEEIEQVTIVVKMVGLFEKIGDESSLKIENFANVNGPAIIFPFIREHISNLSLKAGIGAIVIPPINFEKRRNKLI